MYHTESLLLAVVGRCITQNHYFWLWWVDVSQRIAIFGCGGSMYHTESLLLAVVNKCITQNYYFWLWCVDVKHRITTFGCGG